MNFKTKYPSTLKENLENIIEDCQETIKNLDNKTEDKLVELEWVHRDFTPNDGKTQYYTMIKLKPADHGESWLYDSSDGFCRTGGSAETLEEAWAAAIAIAQDNFKNDKENGWVHNHENVS